MALARIACWACIALLALLAGGPAAAQAASKQDDILVLGRDGSVRAHTATGATEAERRPPRRAVRSTKARKTKRTVVRELKRLRDAGAITPEEYVQRRASYDTAKRTAIYVDMQNILVDELPNFVLFFTQGLAALNKRVKNFYPNASNIRWNAHTFWVTDGK